MTLITLFLLVPLLEAIAADAKQKVHPIVWLIAQCLVIAKQ
jgi:hypothetical protein